MSNSRRHQRRRLCDARTKLIEVQVSSKRVCTSSLVYPGCPFIIGIMQFVGYLPTWQPGHSSLLQLPRGRDPSRFRDSSDHLRRASWSLHLHAEWQACLPSSGDSVLCSWLSTARRNKRHQPGVLFLCSQCMYNSHERIDP